MTLERTLMDTPSRTLVKERTRETDTMYVVSGTAAPVSDTIARQPAAQKTRDTPIRRRSLSCMHGAVGGGM